MKSIATLGPEHSQSWQAAVQYDNKAEIRLYPHVKALLDAFAAHEVEYAVLPVYNTREGEKKQYFRFFDQIKSGYWVDNVILHSTLSLGVFDEETTGADLRLLVGKREAFNQCEEFIENRLPGVTELSVQDIEQAVADIRREGATKGKAVIDSAETLNALGLRIVEREVAPHNRTRYAVLGHSLAPVTGYDATTLITEPLDDRVGILVDILSEFSRRGINIADMRTENDIKTQKLRIYLEAEGHIQTDTLASALAHIESRVIQQQGMIRVLGSFPRVDMRTKYIKSFGFIGTGAMSRWFADRLESEGYEVALTGRSTALRPEEMVRQVDVVVVCVPISVTSAIVRQYGPLIGPGKALILLAGESEETIKAALASTNDEVEIMLMHNLWGPQAATMKDKNAIMVRTPRSGMFCSEFEAFLYKHGADIYHDSPSKHDLLMGIGQKLPTLISVALAMTLHDNGITSEDIASHCTLTSLYPILAMSRVHSQNPRTYAEIMSTAGDSRKIVVDFAKNLQRVIDMADAASIAGLCDVIDANAGHLSESFLQARMQQAKAVDEVLGRMM
ncbi:MAG: prephenate dehydrogenase/arogenate dehydrogenase family protein [Desulfobulbus sp.]|jgi:prephenate dehydratase/prephenate dehydrogenase|uniref:prephenate dehydratase domain-containing protein n=1 Tax=Desulfobulbus sp. TaxID=895 RepID=UPI00283B2046|nr:prephenate dehydratase domain-containing protein [Desulfobulbus sp.]MDR2550577.1 prephenate dehydrogenase/arogenate dehydrogenase family protein [Desulfobulbus sp.]